MENMLPTSKFGYALVNFISLVYVVFNNRKLFLKSFFIFLKSLLIS